MFLGRDILSVIGRCVWRYRTTETIKEYHTHMSNYDNGLQYRRLSYNFRQWNNAFWSGNNIYNLKFEEVAMLPENY